MKPEIDYYLLYPCPCCGAKAKFTEAFNSARWLYWIECTECGLSSPPFPTKEECQEIWNKRVKTKK